MTWWISIVFYLWRNSFRRWIEQPLGVISKLLIACLLGMLGAIMIVGASYLGEELNRQLANREALLVLTTEYVRSEQANAMLAEDDPEEEGWASLSNETLVIYQAMASGTAGGRADIVVGAIRNPEAHGFADGLSYLTERIAEGYPMIVEIDTYRMEAVTRPPTEALKRAARGREMIIGSVGRLAPLLQQGFTRIVVMQASTIEEMEQAHAVANVMEAVEQRTINIHSALDILRQVRVIRDMQRYVLLAAAIGSALVIGLVCGSLAWMEFREERYLLALIRSFGVGALTLLFHSVMENCLLSVGGVLLGFLLLRVAAAQLDLTTMNMTWLSSLEPLAGPQGHMLVAGALLGGLLSCVPIGIGLRKPLGLVLK